MNRIRIRFLDHRDIPFVQKYASDETLAATCNVPHPYPSAGGAAFVERSINGYSAQSHYAFAVECEGEFVGVVTLNGLNLQKKEVATIDYWIGVPFWGKGIATKAVSFAIEYAFKHLGIQKIGSGCLKRNTASRRVLEKNGFKFIGEKPYDGPWNEKFGFEIILVYELIHGDQAVIDP